MTQPTRSDRDSKSMADNDKTALRDHTQDRDYLLASGGGNATAAGVRFQSAVGAWFASWAVCSRTIAPGFRLTDAKIRRLSFETESPLDDILIETTQDGFIFLQAKTTLNLSKTLESPLGEAADQIVRQWIACGQGNSTREWDRPLVAGRDLFLVAFGAGSAGTVSNDLAVALDRTRESGGRAVLPDSQREALAKFQLLLEAAWRQRRDGAPPSGEIARILNFVALVRLDLEGPDRLAAVEMLRGALVDPNLADAAFTTLAGECERLMQGRSSADESQLRAALSARAIRLLAPPDYRADVAAMKRHTGRVSKLLSAHEWLLGDDGTPLHVDRACTPAIVAAIQEASLLAIGEPGAGKSAVLRSVAQALRAAGHEVVMLAVDRLPVEGLDGLRTEIGLVHPVREVLQNWPGTEPAFLIIDALDASRGSKSEAVFRALIDEVLTIPGGRWRILASIRSFDLRHGQRFRDLFSGSPPDARFADPSFPQVQHFKVPAWTDTEFADLFHRAPRLSAAIQAGGDRVRDLARVPFNTRLLADLLSKGLEPTALYQLSTQSDLLRLYWQHRVQAHGPGAEPALAAVVGEMIQNQRLRANRTAAAANPAFDHLLRASVLIPLDGDRYLGFRHHILFDYAASRLFLDPFDQAALLRHFSANQGLGLLLAPALAYSLEELWSSGPAGHPAYWSTSIALIGDTTRDPVARSVAARSACELTRTIADIKGLLTLLAAGANPAFLQHLLGAIGVRLEDAAPITPLDPWVSLASYTSQQPAIESSTRYLLWLLTNQPAAAAHLNELGSAARRLLTAVLAREGNGYSPWLARCAIELVVKTYASDVRASREALARAFEQTRFERYAHHEVPWIADGIETIAPLDPDFAVVIYREVFARSVTSTEETALGNSQILALRSNARQDYNMARYQLKEYFSKFLELNPSAATTALLYAIEGYVAEDHPPTGRPRTAVRLEDGNVVTLQEDYSYIWASDPDEPHARDGERLLQMFVDFLRRAAPEQTRQCVEQLIPANSLAVVWARLFMVGAVRPEVLGDILWPLATHQAFILASDTRKDALDLIAAAYPTRPAEERRTFESSAFRLDWTVFRDPAAARQDILLRLFGAIGASHLESDEARASLESHAAEFPPRNERPVRFTTTSGEPERWYWLRSAGVDVENPSISALLEHSEQLETALALRGQQAPEIDDPAAAITMLEKLERAMTRAEEEGFPLDVLRVPGGAIARGCSALISAASNPLASDPALVARVVQMTLRLARHRHPEGGPDVEADFARSPSWGSPAPRIDAAENVVRLLMSNLPVDSALVDVFARLLADAHPAVRLTVARHIGVLWNRDRDRMWRLAEDLVSREHNRTVINGFLVDFLGGVRRLAPKIVERLALDLANRFADEPEEDAPRSLRDSIGSLFAYLWVESERSDAYARIETWLARSADHIPELSGIISTIREPLIFGYAGGSPEEADMRRRAQQLVALVVDTMATALAAFYRLNPEQQAETGEIIRKQAQLLDHACNQLYFASGAFRDSGRTERGLATDAEKQAFLIDTEAVLRRIGDVGTPSTIHHLVELLEFLLSADPGRAFDLMAHALLEGGRRLGYQHESLGSKVFVRMVGLLLADHRELFQEPARRQKLVDCLAVFIEAGWPEARRLLYRLPELLQ